MPDWQEILNRDGSAVWQTAYRILGNRADADECFQEAFVAALEISRREQIEHGGGLLKRLAAVRAVDRLRQRRRWAARQRAADWQTLPGHEQTPSQVAEDAELSEQLRAALTRLPAKQAEVFCLHCLEGWSYQEVATHLTVSITSVGVLVHRARKRLRLLLEIAPLVPCSRRVRIKFGLGADASPKGRLMSTQPPSSFPEDPLARAEAAFRRMIVPDGPSAETVERTLAALRAQTHSNSTSIPRRKPMFTAMKIAAALLVTAGGLLYFAVAPTTKATAAFADAAEKLRKAHTLSWTARPRNLLDLKTPMKKHVPSSRSRS